MSDPRSSVQSILTRLYLSYTEKVINFSDSSYANGEIGKALRAGSKRWPEHEDKIAAAVVKSSGEYKINHTVNIDCARGATHFVVSLFCRASNTNTNERTRKLQSITITHVLTFTSGYGWCDERQARRIAP